MTDTPDTGHGLHVPHKARPFLIAGAVGLGVWYLYNRRNAAATVTSSTTTTTDPTADGTLPDVSPMTTGTGPTVTGSTLPAIGTNDQWQSEAIQYLIARGLDPAFAQTAVTKAFEAEPLSPAEQSAMSLAIGALGNPPDGIPPLNALPPAGGVHTPTPPPPPVTVVTGPDAHQLHLLHLLHMQHAHRTPPKTAIHPITR